MFIASFRCGLLEMTVLHLLLGILKGVKVRSKAMPYSRITSKGQITIPADARRKYGLESGSIVTLEETKKGLLLKRVPDIVTSAGVLSEFGDAKDAIQSLVKSRTKAFR
jgi:AbrB family looped-hinge helix DNA binding protein